MANETPETYEEFVLSLADLYTTTALDVQSKLGDTAPAVAVIGAILEEFNDRNEDGYTKFEQWAADVWSDAFNDYFTSHEDMAAKFQEARSLGAEWRESFEGLSKLSEPILLDVGVGNIQIYTAIELLLDYKARYANSDPLALNVYTNDYLALARDLSNPYSTATVKFAALKVQKAFEWAPQNVPNWESLSSLEKEAFSVFFYNVKLHAYQQSRDEFFQANGYQREVDIDNTPIAQEYLINYGAIVERFLPSNYRFEGLREVIASGAFDTVEERCFLPHTPITLADGTMRAIEAIRPGDHVLSYAADGSLTPARVTRTFVNEAACVLDFHGTGVTPGHVFLCGTGRFAGRHVPLIDTLRDDSAVVWWGGSLMQRPGRLREGEGTSLTPGAASPMGFLAQGPAPAMRGGARCVA